MTILPGNIEDVSIDEPAAAVEDEIDQVLDAAQQAWEQGETLLIWVDRYPAYAPELGELALSRERQRFVPELTEEESAAVGKSIMHAMDSVLSPARQSDH